MISTEAVAALTHSVLNEVNNLFSDEKTWALQEVLRAYCRHGCPDDMTKEVSAIIAKMSEDTTLGEAIDTLETWAEARLKSASS